jgi:hypothetical protein
VSTDLANPVNSALPISLRPGGCSGCPIAANSHERSLVDE